MNCQIITVPTATTTSAAEVDSGSQVVQILNSLKHISTHTFYLLPCPHTYIILASNISQPSHSPPLPPPPPLHPTHVQTMYSSSKTGESGHAWHGGSHRLYTERLQKHQRHPQGMQLLLPAVIVQRSLYLVYPYTCSHLRTLKWYIFVILFVYKFLYNCCSPSQPKLNPWG